MSTKIAKKFMLRHNHVSNHVNVSHVSNRQFSSIAFVLSFEHTFYWSLIYCHMIVWYVTQYWFHLFLINALRCCRAHEGFNENDEKNVEEKSEKNEKESHEKSHEESQLLNKRRRHNDCQCSWRRFRYASYLRDNRRRKKWKFHCW